MDPVKVVIENWPKTNYLIVYVPLIIALIALGVSLYSVRQTRKSFIASHRPYVCAMNYAVLDRNTIIPDPHRVAYRVINSPAKIIRSEVRVNLSGETLFAHTDVNIVRFPVERSEWYVSIGQENFQNMLNRANEDKTKLQRLISIDYSSLDGGKIYHYELQQSFNPAANQWKDTSENAD
jgi:hypothetical protein